MLQSQPIRRAEQLGIACELRVIQNDGWRMSPHWHDDLQIIATLDGCGEVVIDAGDPLLLPAGALAVIPPRAPHTAYAIMASGWTFHSLHIDPARLGDLPFDAFEGFVVASHHPLAVGFTSLVRALFRRRPGDLKSKCEHFLRLLRARIEVAATGERRSGDRIDRIADALRQDLAARMSIPELAERYQVSAGYLSRRFRERFGVPPHAWRIIARVEAAKRHLRCGASVASAAQLAGFSDSAHLARQCKHWTGLTPRSFKKADR